jgi:hypothetical protein
MANLTKVFPRAPPLRFERRHNAGSEAYPLPAAEGLSAAISVRERHDREIIPVALTCKMTKCISGGM